MIEKILNGLSKATETYQIVSDDILLLRFTIVNACIVGGSTNWALVDTGLESSADFILKNAEGRYGKGTRPKSIVLTHGHFDHVGSVIRLSDLWDVPVYAHEKEIPYLTGQKDYPQADSTVDEGLVAKMSPGFPHKAINLGHRVVALPSDGSIPGMPEWYWIPTPGHTEGHVSFFHKTNRKLIAGDAFTTTKQESLTSVMSQKDRVKGPPAYLTTDWAEAKKSVDRIRELKPVLAIPGHGDPLGGEELVRHLDMLVNRFEEIAVPEQGRFVRE